MTAPTQRYLEILRNLPLFLEVRQADLDALVPSVRTVHAERRKVLFKRGDPCEGFHMLVSGKVKLSLVSSQGVDKPLDIVTAGGSFGDITMLLERPYYLTAQALEDSLLLYLPRDAIVRLIESDSRFAMRMLASLSMRMRNVVDDIECFSLQPPAARLVTYLLRLLPPGSMTPAKIELSMHKNVVAAQLNLTPETLSRHFRELADRGLLSLEGRTIVVNDIDRLGEYVADRTKL
ncbi:Crp/Fnr family transcriptional regulator [Variovorax sp. J31P179]|uniref:Crp/Fnr family transcriptional regulator n=1 Tax=Variovorax sp. J31P179 TaxID=3053508 RepID=UPI0025749385|nr:Crp/Fnr family transcriptional regulator [Variovorax sp. J31P179]MDM0081536.1 Crp/Fnr family transcriptional regulator [Variovorax sp. J31P179]HET7834826.1 Crp/Fnr family transcriptional regulator [Variovorax sp.]